MKSIYFRHSATRQDEWTFYRYSHNIDTGERDASILLDKLIAKGHDHAEVSITDESVTPAKDILT